MRLRCLRPRRHTLREIVFSTPHVIAGKNAAASIPSSHNLTLPILFPRDGSPSGLIGRGRTNMILLRPTNLPDEPTLAKSR